MKSINGGLIVDSCDWPTAFRGLYFFGDNVTGSLWTVQPTPARDGIVAGSQKDFGNVASAVSFRVGPDNALYIASLGPGRIIRFEPKTKEMCPTPMPDAGTDTGTPDPDAGPVEDTGASTSDSSSIEDTFAPAATPGTSDEGGCGCSTPGSGAARHSWFALALMIFVLRRRR